MEITLKEIPASTKSNEYSNFIPIFIGPYLKENKQYVTNTDISNGYVDLNIDSDYLYYDNSLLCNIEYNEIVKSKTDIIVNSGSLPRIINISEYKDLSVYTNAISLIVFNSQNDIVHTSKITPLVDVANKTLSIILDSTCNLTNGTYSYIIISKTISTNVTYSNGRAYFPFSSNVYQNKISSSSYITFKTYYNKPLIYNSYTDESIDFIEPYNSIFSLCKYFIFINNVGSSQDVVDRLSLNDYGYYISSFDTPKQTVDSIINSIISDSNRFKTIITSTDLVEVKTLVNVTYTKS